MFELNSGDIEQSPGLPTGYNESSKKRTWAAFLGWDKLFLLFLLISLIFALAAVLVLLTPVLNVMVGFMGLSYAGWTEWQEWIMAGERGLIIASALGLIALLFALLARYRLSRDFSVYMEAGCPQCHEHELIRVHRNHKDRALGKLGLLVRRYSCRNCTWHGLRLSGYRFGRNEKSSAAYAVGDSNSALIDAQIEPVEESLPVDAMRIEEITGAGIQESGEDALSNREDIAVSPVVALAEPSEDLVSENNVYLEDWAAESQFVEKVSVESIDVAEAESYQLIAGDLDQEMEGGSNLLEREPHEDDALTNAPAESDSAGDEFARLCYKVAQSKE